VFHAGTRRLADGRLVVDGGRVLAVTALGEGGAAARAAAYRAAARIRFAGQQLRTDIGARPGA
jgi:phosphoribosylamine--glycine ligase